MAVANVGVAVQADRVSLSRHTLDQLRLGGGSDGDREERCLRADCVKQVQQSRRPHRIGAIVEGQRHA